MIFGYDKETNEIVNMLTGERWVPKSQNQMDHPDPYLAGINRLLTETIADHQCDCQRNTTTSPLDDTIDAVWNALDALVKFRDAT